MNCKELVKYLSDYIDNNLTDELRADAQAHLATCHNCHIVLDTTQKTIWLYKQQGETGMPASKRSDLFNKLQKAIEQKNQA